MGKKLCIVEHYLCNNGEYEDRWAWTEFFGVFENFGDACDAIQQVIDKHKFMSDNKVEDQHGDVLEFCEYEEKYDEATDTFTVTWCMNSGGYMCDYMHQFTVTKTEIGKYDPDVDPGF
jgi:hypothetical protein